MFKSVVYWGNSLLGEVEIYPQNQKIDMSNKQIRISHFSQPSERCPPLAVLHTIARSGVCFKMESKSQLEDSPLFSLHSSCLREKKTAVMQLGEEELHLVAISSRKSPMQYPCFWGFNLAPGLYKSCLILLNLRCLGIVFDLDETLVVANTIRSFEDRIDALQRKVNTEMDPVRISGMLAEIKRYQDDRNILKQYVESDQVVENGKVIKVQSEVVPALSDYHQSIVRPIIRLQEKNIILTRINPMIRDTSVLVRLRPAWEDLRTYITAKGRKRFEVYVCTMAEKDYALEMWRLLDPDSNLINSKELPDRIVSVKAGSKKSLLNVFHDGTCHPKMALVIDDRVNVWEEIDQPRVHIVPAFAPYYSPQAEANNAVPVLCVARNVACNVRGGFFKEFDEDLLQRILGVFYEDDICSIPSPPDVSNYLSSEDDVSTSNKDPLHFEGITDVEVERRLKDAILSSSMVKNLDPRFVPLQLSTATSSSTVSQFTSQGSIVSLHDKQLPQAASSVNSLGYGGPLEPSLQSSPGREEGEVPESELDPDTRRRLLILQHGQDMREQTSSEPISLRPLKVSAPPVQSHGRWFPLEEEMSPRQLNLAVPKPVTKEIHVESEALLFDNRRPPRPSFFHGAKSYGPFDRTLHNNRRFHKEAHHGDDWLRSKNSFPKYHPFSGEEMPLALSDSSKRDLHFELERGSPPYAETPTGVLQDIAVRCGAKVEFRPALLASTELQFSIEVWFAGEKISEGIGKTRKEAQHQASERCIKNLADKYLSITTPDHSAVLEDLSKLSHENENYSNSFGHQPFPKEEPMPISITSELSRLMDPRLEGSKKSVGAVSALTELCIMEGLTLGFQSQPSLSTSSIHKGEARVQAEIGGKILGKGIGLTWDEAKIRAAEEALGNLKSMLDQGTHKRLGFSKVVTRTPK